MIMASKSKPSGKVILATNSKSGPIKRPVARVVVPVPTRTTQSRKSSGSKK